MQFAKKFLHRSAWKSFLCVGRQNLSEIYRGEGSHRGVEDRGIVEVLEQIIEEWRAVYAIERLDTGPTCR